MFRLSLACVLAAAWLSSAPASDVPIQGDRARLTDIPKDPRAQIVSYSAAIDLMNINPAVSGSTLDIFSPTTGQQLTLTMPASQWKGPLPGRHFRFSATGDPKIKAIIVNGRLLRIVVNGTGGFALGQPEGSIAVRLTIGGTRFCTVFGGTITRDDGRRFSARQAPAPAACPVAPSDHACASVVCGAQDACHDIGVCNPLTGACSNPPKTDGAPCTDGDACTQTDTCQAGSCSGGNPVVCFDEKCHEASTCNPTTGTCSLGAAKLDGTPCDDGAACTASSSCQAGTCVSSGPTCRNENDQSDRSYCDFITGACVTNTDCPPFQLQPDGTPNLCKSNTGKDPATGLCLYQGTFCPAQGCNIEECEASTGLCKVLHPSIPNCGVSGQVCNNRDNDLTPCDVTLCTYAHCRRGVLLSNCDAQVTRSCAVENPSTCQDAAPCNETDGCVYTGKTCAPPADPCQQLVMDPNATGCCTYVPKDCAAQFGNNPGFTYACTAGVCAATPQP